MAKKVFNLEGPVINDASMFGSFYTGKKISSSSVDKVVEYLDENDDNKAYIKISSPGGDVLEAKTIIGKLQPYKARVDFEVLGFAASAGSYIPLAAGSNVFMREGSLMMNHEPMIRSMKPMNRYDLKKEIEVLDLIAENLIDVISSKTEKDSEEVRENLKNEKYYDAKNAKEEGLIDGILEENENTKSALEKYKAEYENFDKIYLNFAKEVNSKVINEDAADDLVEDEVEENAIEEQEEIAAKITEEKSFMSEKNNDDMKQVYESKIEGYLSEIKELQKQVKASKKKEQDLLLEKRKWLEEANERAIQSALDRGAILPIEKEYYKNEFKNAQYESTMEKIRDSLNNKEASDYYTLNSKPFSKNDINSIPVETRKDYEILGLSEKEMLESYELKVKHNLGGVN